MQQGMWCNAKATVRFTPEEEDALGRLKAASRNVPRWHLRRNFHWIVTAPLAIGYAVMALQSPSASAIVVPALSAAALFAAWVLRPDFARQVLDAARVHPALVTRVECRGEADDRVCLVTLAGMAEVAVAQGDQAEATYGDLTERMARSEHGPIALCTGPASTSALRI